MQQYAKIILQTLVQTDNQGKPLPASYTDQGIWDGKTFKTTYGTSSNKFNILLVPNSNHADNKTFQEAKKYIAEHETLHHHFKAVLVPINFEN